MSSSNRCGLLVTAYKYLIIFLTLKVANGVPQSPCPNVFEYQYDDTKNLIGIIKVPTINDYGNLIRLDVQLSVGNRVQGFKGSIKSVTPLPQAYENLIHKRPLLYYVYFPYWERIPPVITRIAVNDNQICYGHPIDRNLAPLITMVDLHYKLMIGITSNTRSQENLDPFSNYVDPESEFNFRPSINYNTQPPQDPSRYNDYNLLSPPQSHQFPDRKYQSFYTNQPDNSHYYQSNYPRHNFSPNNYNYNDYNNDNENNGFFYQFGNPQKNSGNQFDPFTDRPAIDNNNNQNNEFFSNQGDPSTNSHHSRGQFTPPTEKTVEVNFTPTQKPLVTDIEEQLPTIDTNRIRQPLSDMCGISVQTNTLLVNGNRVKKGIIHPWLAAIFMQSNDGLRFSCGSTLISQKHVITAAHCVQNKRKKIKPEEIWIVLGREDIQQWSSPGSQTIQAESINVHGDYAISTADADIAVVTLTEEAIFSNLIKPACLWTGDKNAKLILEQKGTVVGWGRDGTGKFYSPQPRQFDFPVISEENCLRSNPAFAGITSDRTFCAGYKNGTGPCNGDSGSGFLLKVNGRWTLRGVVSMSLLREDGTCDLKEYVVYTDVAQFIDWILSFLW